MSSDLIKALKDPARYDHPVNRIELRETHISWVLLTGEFAYKIKKPMDFGFLDFSTVERRHHFCNEELRLNRRLAPEIYDSVIPITGSAQAPVVGGDGEPIEYAIRMRQFDPDNQLDNLHAQDRLEARHMDFLAEELAAFHASLPGTDSDFGSPSAVGDPLVQNFQQIRSLLDDQDLLKQLDQIEAWALITHERLQERLAARHAQGHIRECHGDLHLANITLIDGKVTIFDCIEFNPAFRWIDTCSDLAFLLMDLEFRGSPDMANRVLNRYLEITGDFDCLPLVDFYKAYRAVVRAKIALLTRNDPNLPADERAALLDQYRRYADLADSYEAIPNRYLLATTGLSGSGKSYLSRGLSQALGLIHLRSDVERKRLFDLRAEENSRDRGIDIYSPAATEKTYQRLEHLAAQVLAAGWPVIVDAASLRHSEREGLIDIAETQCAPHLILHCTASEKQMQQWLEKRQAEGGDASEADATIMQDQKAHEEPLNDVERACTVHINMMEDNVVEAVVARIQNHFGL